MHDRTILAGLLVLALASPASADPPTPTITGPDATPGVKVSGKTVLHVIRWSDAHGDNVAVLSRTMKDRGGTGALYVDVYAGTKKLGKVRTVRELASERCLGDMSAEGNLSNLTVAEFVPATFGVTDTDGDGVGELMVGYRAGCGLADTITAKIVVLEGKTKHARRGTATIDPDGSFTAGSGDSDVTEPGLETALDAAWAHIGDRTP